MAWWSDSFLTVSQKNKKYRPLDKIKKKQKQLNASFIEHTSAALSFNILGNSENLITWHLDTVNPDHSGCKQTVSPSESWRKQRSITATPATTSPKKTKLVGHHTFIFKPSTNQVN